MSIFSRLRGVTPVGRAMLVMIGFTSVIAGSMVLLAVADPGTAPAQAVASAKPDVAPPVGVTEVVTESSLPTGDELELRLVSQDGRYQAWSEPLPDGATIYEPGGRTHTTIVVKDRLTGGVNTITLDRNVEPEAFSPDGTRLFVIDHRPATAPDHYRVSSIELSTGRLTEVLGPLKVPVPEEMRGVGRQQVWAPDGTQLYTLYVRQYHDHAAHNPSMLSVGQYHDHAAHDPSTEHAPPEAAFVHVLDVVNGWAICLVLPDGFGLGPAGTTAIMVSDGGQTITVVDHHLGQRIDISRLADSPTERARFTVGEPFTVGQPR